jgi:hypothetical protein
MRESSAQGTHNLPARRPRIKPRRDAGGPAMRLAFPASPRQTRAATDAVIPLRPPSTSRKPSARAAFSRCRMMRISNRERRCTGFPSIALRPLRHLETGRAGTLARRSADRSIHVEALHGEVCSPRISPATGLVRAQIVATASSGDVEHGPASAPILLMTQLAMLEGAISIVLLRDRGVDSDGGETRTNGCLSEKISILITSDGSAARHRRSSV